MFGIGICCIFVCVEIGICLHWYLLALVVFGIVFLVLVSFGIGVCPHSYFLALVFFGITIRRQCFLCALASTCCQCVAKFLCPTWQHLRYHVVVGV